MKYEPQSRVHVTSYPFLHLSRQLCVPYSTVLIVADLLDVAAAHEIHDGALDTCESLSKDDLDRVLAVVMHEEERRKNVI